jgi:hypothetical protein
MGSSIYSFAQSACDAVYSAGKTAVETISENRKLATAAAIATAVAGAYFLGAFDLSTTASQVGWLTTTTTKTPTLLGRAAEFVGASVSSSTETLNSLPLVDKIPGVGTYVAKAPAAAVKVAYDVASSGLQGAWSGLKTGGFWGASAGGVIGTLMAPVEGISAPFAGAAGGAMTGGFFGSGLNGLYSAVTEGYKSVTWLLS